MLTYTLSPTKYIPHPKDLVLRIRDVAQLGVDFINCIIFTFLINTIKYRVLMHYLELINYAMFVKTMHDKIVIRNNTSMCYLNSF